MSKYKNQQMHLFYVLANLQLEVLDNLKTTTPKMEEYKKYLIAFCEEINNTVAKTETVLKTTYFQEISVKVMTVIRKNFDGTL